MKIFENRRLKGAISIFLVIITIPTMLLSAVLIDGSRSASARAMAREATDLAAFSVLASYNQVLKDEFGLFALNEGDSQKIKAVFEESLNATLLAHGMSGDKEYSDRLWEIMKTTLTGQKSYIGQPFLNLYDFSVDQCSVEPIYALANQEVLETQMVEYAKFRGLYVMADRMDIFSSLDNAKDKAKVNQVTAEVMEDKMDADEANASADRELAKLREELAKLNSAVLELNNAKETYFESLAGKMEEIRLEHTDGEEELTQFQKHAAKEYQKSQDALTKKADSARKQAKAVLKQAKKAKKEVETAIKRLETFQSGNRGKAAGNESAGDLLKDAQGNIEAYKLEYLPHIQEIIDDPVINQLEGHARIKKELEQVMEDIHEAVTRYIDILEDMEDAKEDSQEGGEDEEEPAEEENTEYYYYFLQSEEYTPDAGEAMEGRPKSYKPSVDGIVGYVNDKSWDPERVNPSKKYNQSFPAEIDEEFAKGQSEKKGSAESSLDGEAKKGAVEDSVYQARPSKTWSGEKGKNSNTGFYNKDGDLTASKDILNQGKRSMILDIGETARDDILCFTYMFGTFKTRLTGVNKFSSQGISDSDKESFYMPKWRYAHPDGELDMRFSPKKDRNTVLRSEIEYLVYGNKTDTANEAAVYATIFAERMANNLVVMYGEKKIINPACHAAAAAACAATFGVVPEPVFFWIFLTAWATAETILEMDYLISGGYRIPLIKTTENILLKNFPSADGQGLISGYGKKGIFVSYEDYLLILLLLKGREKRIMRTADLIEMNMKNSGETDFSMAKAYTWIHGDTKLSIRYMFGSVMPFEESYREQGYTGRMTFTNTVYLGY